ncbi:cobalt ECF transporter T component CbiQ [Desulfovibrionales bacterium]
MIEEPFAQGESWIHHLDPRARLVMATLFALTVALSRHLSTGLVGLALGMLVLTASRPPLGPLMRRLCAINVFLVFLGITVPLTMPGSILWTFGPLHVSLEGVLLALAVTLKANAIMFVFIAFVASIPFPTLGHALEYLGVPRKLTFLLLFTYRYIHTLAGEWRRLHTASRLRGFVPRTGLHTYRTVGHMLGMVLVNSFDRAGRVYQAMLLRGFTGQFTSVRQFSLTFLDRIMLVIWLALMILVLTTDMYMEV